MDKPEAVNWEVFATVDEYLVRFVDEDVAMDVALEAAQLGRRPRLEYLKRRALDLQKRRRGREYPLAEEFPALVDSDDAQYDELTRAWGAYDVPLEEIPNIRPVDGRYKRVRQRAARRLGRFKHVGR